MQIRGKQTNTAVNISFIFCALKITPANAGMEIDLCFLQVVSFFFCAQKFENKEPRGLSGSSVPFGSFGFSGFEFRTHTQKQEKNQIPSMHASTELGGMVSFSLKHDFENISVDFFRGVEKGLLRYCFENFQAEIAKRFKLRKKKH